MPIDYYPLQDLLYRTTALTNAVSDIVETYDTDAYGNTLIFNDAGTGGDWWADDSTQTFTPINTFIFTGRRYDPETEVYYYRARYYDPDQGRFISRDPSNYQNGTSEYAAYFVLGGTLDPSGRAAEEKPAIACGPHTIEPLGKRAPEINGRGRRTEGATTSLWNLNYTTDTEGCPSNCNKLTLTSCDAATLYWWSSDDSKTHEEVHVNDWGTYWTKYYTDALKYMNKCKKIDITACYAEVIGALYKLYRQQGLVAGLEFDCKEYGRLIPDVCEKARFEKKMATQAAMDLLTIRNKCDGLESKG